MRAFVSWPHTRTLFWQNAAPYACYCFDETTLMALPIRIHFLWNIYIKTKGRLLKIFNSIKYLTLVYIMAKNINYHIYKAQIIFPPLLSVYNYFFDFSHCLLPVIDYTSMYHLVSLPEVKELLRTDIMI